MPFDAAREVGILNDANPPVRSPELPDHVHRDFHRVVVRGLLEPFSGKEMLAASSQQHNQAGEGLTLMGALLCCGAHSN